MLQHFIQISFLMNGFGDILYMFSGAKCDHDPIGIQKFRLDILISYTWLIFENIGEHMYQYVI
ncbi:hypothetical protein C9J01_05910 [Photobacterium rosenbergii]|uniref:Uncharacterized protein n=1 Tax=Photobacterium rosenbergii TaxID=294936 RepID=A0A2T3NM30_9GAMM|nr:hypothetical protein C9J01_05910 [Photobacterium rosenbergii]